MHVHSCYAASTSHAPTAPPCHMRNRMQHLQRPSMQRLPSILRCPNHHSLAATAVVLSSSTQSPKISHSRRRAISLHATPQKTVSSTDLQQKDAGAQSSGSFPAASFPDPFSTSSDVSTTSPVVEAEATASPAAEQVLPNTPTESATDTRDPETVALESESYMGLGELADVEELRGCRVKVDGNGKAIIEYLVNWKDDAPDTWEVKENVAENVLRDYEDKWWGACRDGDEAVVKEMLIGARRVLVHAIDENRRSALHFSAAIGNVKVLQMLCQAGADVNLGDKDGYTALHMAAGYLHVPAVVTLLEAGANPEVKDRKGQSVLDLAESLKAPMAGDPPRRFALEKVAEILIDTLYDELEPMQVLDARAAVEEGCREFLIQWPDSKPDSWVHQRFVAEDVVQDYDAGLEFAEAAAILRVVQRGDQRQCLIRWSDGEADSWEDEENVSPALVDSWLSENGQQAVQLNPRRRPEQPRMPAKGKRKAASSAGRAADPVAV